MAPHGILPLPTDSPLAKYDVIPLGNSLQQWLHAQHPSRRPQKIAGLTLALAYFCDRDGMGWPRHRDVARFFGCTPDAVSKQVRGLIDRGLLTESAEVEHLTRGWRYEPLRILVPSAGVLAVIAVILESG